MCLRRAPLVSSLLCALAPQVLRLTMIAAITNGLNICSITIRSTRFSATFGFSTATCPLLPPGPDPVPEWGSCCGEGGKKSWHFIWADSREMLLVRYGWSRCVPHRVFASVHHHVFEKYYSQQESTPIWPICRSMLYCKQSVAKARFVCAYTAKFWAGALFQLDGSSVRNKSEPAAHIGHSTPLTAPHVTLRI
jgi:hypothetical protein